MSGGGGGGPSQQTVTQTNIPDWLRPQAETVLGGAMQEMFTTSPGAGGTLNITGVRPFTPYSADPTQYVAPLSPLQQQAMGNAANLQMPGQYNVASNMAQQAGLGGLQAAQQAGLYGGAGYQAGLAGQGLGMQAAQDAALQAAMAQQGAYGYGSAGYQTGLMGQAMGAQAAQDAARQAAMAQQASYGYGGQGAQAGLAGQAMGAQAAQDAARQAAMAQQAAYGYGGQGAQAGALGQQLATQGGAYYGGMGANYGAQAARLGGAAQQYGRTAADIGRQALAARQTGADVGDIARGYSAEQAGLGRDVAGLAGLAQTYGAQAAALSPEALQYGRGAADIGSMALRAQGMGEDIAQQARGYAAQQAGAGGRYAAGATSPEAMQAYMSPYMRNVIDTQQQAAQRQSDIASQAQRAQYARAGALGGGRQTIAASQAAADLARQKGAIEAQGLQQAFQQAQQAQQFGAGLDLQGLAGAQQGLGTALAGGQLGLSGIGQAMAGQQAGAQSIGQALAAQQAGLAGLGQAGQLYGQGVQGLSAAQQGLGNILQGGQLGLSGIGQAMAGQQVGLAGLGQAGQLYGLGMQGAGMGLQGLQQQLAGTAQGMQGAGMGLQGVGQALASGQLGLQGAQAGMQGAGLGIQGAQAGMQGVGQAINAGQLGLQGAGTGLQGIQAGMQGAGMGLQGIGQAVNAGQLGLQGAGVGLQGAQAGMQGAGVGLQGVQGGLGGYGLLGQQAGTLGALGAQQLAGQQGIIGLQSQLGGLDQQQQQNIINQAIQNYAMQQQYPLQQYAAYNALLRGYANPGQTTTSYQAAPSMASQLGGLGMGAYGVSQLLGGGRAKGGKIEAPKRMATGGIASINRKVLLNPDSVSEDQIRQGVQNGVISDLIGVPILAQKAQAAQQMQAAQAAQQNQNQEPIKQQLMAAQQPQGIPALPSNLPEQMAGGGIVAFAGGGLGDSEEDDDPNAALLGEIQKRFGEDGGDPVTYQKLVSMYPALLQNIVSYKPQSMTDEDRSAYIKKYIESVQEGAGESPYDAMTKRMQDIEGEGKDAKRKALGIAALKAGATMMSTPGGFARSLGAGIGAGAPGYEQAIAAERAEKRALANMQFHLADAQRKERMGMRRDAISALNLAEKDRAALNQAELAKRRGNIDLTARLAASVKPGTPRAPGQVKLPEQLAAAEIAYETNPTEENANKVKALRRAVAQTRTSDIGPGKAAAGAMTVQERINKTVTDQLGEFPYTNEGRQYNKLVKQASKATGEEAEALKAQAETLKKAYEDNARRVATQDVYNQEGIKLPDAGTPPVVPPATAPAKPATQTKPDISTIQGAPAGAKIGAYTTGKGWEVLDSKGKLIGYSR